jgi:serine/threonine protein kinase
MMNQTVGPFPRKYVEAAGEFSPRFDRLGVMKNPELLCAENGEDFVRTFEPFYEATTVRNIIGGGARGEDPLDTPEVRAAFIDLVEKMLKIDPDERISAEDALQHPFMALQNFLR